MTRRHLADPSPYESGIWGTEQVPCPSERTIAAHLDGELDRRRSDAVEAHLDVCRRCAGAAARFETLSGVLRAWDAKIDATPPPRLAAAILRTVSPEADALRRESFAQRLRSFAAAAAAVLVAVGGVVAGVVSAGGAGRSAAASGALPASVASVAPHLAPISFGGADGFVRSARDEAFVVAVPAPLAPSSDAPVPESPLRDAPFRDAPFRDPEATLAMARYGGWLGTQERVGEAVYIVGDRALPVCAAAPYARLRRLEAWYAERERSLAELVTVDPAAKGLSVLDLLPLPAAEAIPAFVARLPRLLEPATRRCGGLVVRPLPGRPTTPGDAPTSDAAGDAANDDASDLLSAVETGHVVLAPDFGADRTTVTLEVRPTTRPILIPSGELLTGGAGDRVVTEGIWLPASESPRTVVLACVPVSRDSSPSGVPSATGLVVGPELRGLLSYRADPAAVLALVDGQIADAALDRGEPGAASLLALYDPTSVDVTVARAVARELASRFDEGTAGFVVSDPNGRFQGLETTTIRGASRRVLLERLLVGYLVESCTRTSVDAPRSGSTVEVALARLVESSTRLVAGPSAISLRGGVATIPVPGAAPSASATPPVPARPRRLSGHEPRSGLRFEGVPGESPRPPLVSGLVPGIR